MNKQTKTVLLLLIPIVGISTFFYFKGHLSATDTISNELPAMSNQQAPMVLDDSKWYKLGFEQSNDELKTLLKNTPINVKASKEQINNYKLIEETAFKSNNFWIAAFAKEKIADALLTDTSYLESGGLFIELSTTKQDNDEQRSYLLAKAKQQYQKAVKINPDNIMANNSLAVSIIQLGQDPPMLGIGYIKKSLQLDSNDLNTNYIYANMLLISKQYEKAIVVYNKLVNLQPDNAEHYFQLSKIYADLNDPTKSKEFLEKAKSLIKK